MIGLIKFVRHLFNLPENSSEQVKHEMLIRSQSYRLAYQKWLRLGRNKELLKNFYTSYTLGRLGIAGEIPLHTFQDESRRHLLVHYIDNLGRDLFPFLLDYFKDSTLKMGYQVSLSERKIVERLGYIEKTEKHVLRPAVSSFQGAGRKEQLYGIISLQISYVDERPLFLELISEEIVHRNYTAAFAFDEYIEILFS